VGFSTSESVPAYDENNHYNGLFLWEFHTRSKDLGTSHLISVIINAVDNVTERKPQ
jgi:hypothetical protein